MRLGLNNKFVVPNKRLHSFAYENEVPNKASDTLTHTLAVQDKASVCLSVWHVLAHSRTSIHAMQKKASHAHTHAMQDKASHT
jgi:hypothetical protein